MGETEPRWLVHDAAKPADSKAAANQAKTCNQATGTANQQTAANYGQTENYNQAAYRSTLYTTANHNQTENNFRATELFSQD